MNLVVPVSPFFLVNSDLTDVIAQLSTRQEHIVDLSQQLGLNVLVWMPVVDESQYRFFNIFSRHFEGSSVDFDGVIVGEDQLVDIYLVEA